MPEPIIATVSDVRAVRTGMRNSLCVPGMRAWFKQHNLDFESFVHIGLPVETLEATGDHFAILVCRAARERAART